MSAGLTSYSTLLFACYFLILMCCLSTPAMPFQCGDLRHNANNLSCKFMITDGASKSHQVVTFFDKIMSWLPWGTQDKIKEKLLTPKAGLGKHYLVQLVRPSAMDRRHIESKVMSFYPDISLTTASDIVETAINTGKGLIRVVASKDDALAAAAKFRYCYPPIHVTVTEVSNTGAETMIQS